MLLLRIFAPSCRYRISVSETATLYELHELIIKESKQSDTIKKIHVFLNANNNSIVPRSRQTTVAESGICDGQVLYVHWTLIPKEKHPESLEIEPTVDDSATKQNVDKEEAIQSQGTNVSTTSNKSLFKSFDAFLKEKLYSIAELPLCVSYRPVNISKNHLTKLPPAVTLKHQPYRHIDHVEFKNYTELNNFVNFWQYDLDMAQQRGGWLLGHYVEDSHYELGIRAVVEAIYEPPQANTENGSVVFLEDSFFPTVQKLSETLGISIVGWVFTHLPREQKLTSSEVLHIIKLQWESVKSAPVHYTGYPISPFVTVTISQPEEGKIQTNAFMVSDLAMAFCRDGLFASTQEDPAKLKLAFPLKHLAYPEILESGKAVSHFDPDWLIVRVNESAPIKSSGMFKLCKFPVENRFDNIDSDHVVNAIKNISNDKTASFSDFHFLIYLAKLFDLGTADSICHAIRHNHPVDSEIVDTLLTFAQ